MCEEVGAHRIGGGGWVCVSLCVREELARLNNYFS